MFLHQSVSHSVHRGVWQTHALPGRNTHPLLGRHPQADTRLADTPWKIPTPPPKTATEVGGMHPTGMHSCPQACTSPLGMHTPHGHTCPPQAHMPPGHTWPWAHIPPPPGQILRDAVNERAVRILLECILALVQSYFIPSYSIVQRP